jgi:peptidoglycan hydrolase-like protein with peptidoglycan-binding domain
MQTNRVRTIGGCWLLALALSASPATAASMQVSDAQSRQPQMHMETPMHPGQVMQSQKDTPVDMPIYIGPAALQKIQQRLSRKGNNAGPADGIWGRATASAVKRFQRSLGLEPTGNLNIETIQALGLPEILHGKREVISGGKKRGPKDSRQGTQLYISPAALREVQESLRTRGLDVGRVDGLWGEKTREAIRRYQHDNDMAPTGHIDLSVLDRLGMTQLVEQLGFGVGGLGSQEAMVRKQGGNQAPVNDYYGKGGESNKRQQDRVLRVKKWSVGHGTPLYAGPDIVRRIQQALSDAGHSPGEINGHWTATTARAIGAYQIAQNLVPTGTLTITTMQKLIGGAVQTARPQ